MGYHNRLTNSVVVEFDTWNSYNWDLGRANHIAIHSRGTAANSADYNLAGRGYGLAPFTILAGGTHTARIRYDAVAHTLSVFLDGRATPTAVANIDLSTLLSLDNGTAWVGFTAATGGAMSNHDILSWSYAPHYEWSGFHDPLSHKSDYKLGSTVPVKFSLTGWSAGITDLNATLKIDGQAVGTFRYDATDGHYIANWRTKGFSAGNHTLSVDLGDGVVRQMTVTLK